ncbi:MAG: type II secretion system protein GspM [Allosphingosinicella sp.]
MNALADWWRLRTQREQRLLFVMFALIGLVLAWLLVVRPLSDALDSARRDHAAAVTALADARARAETGRLLRGQRTPPAALPIDNFLNRTAIEAGFANARIVASGPARATIAIDAARPQAFFAWVRQMEQGGLVVEMLRARANGDRTLAVEAGFRARSS